MKSLEKDKNTRDWFDKNKFKTFQLLLIATNLITGHKKGEFKYIDIKDLVNNIRNKAISEISAKKKFKYNKRNKKTHE